MMLNNNSECCINIINHRQIMKKLYKDCETRSNYVLKPEIFKYITKIKSNLLNNSRKRKSKKPSSTEEQNPPLCEDKLAFQQTFTNEIKELQKQVDEFIAKNPNIQQVVLGGIVLDSTVDSNINLDEIVNETITFPRFRGANPSNTITKITLNNHDYIIPPRSEFFNYNIKNMNEIQFDKKFDLIILDPPWYNKFICRLKKSKFKSSSAYEMLNNDCIVNLPIQDLTNSKSLVVIWCTNSYQHQTAILKSFLPAWKLKFLTKWYWMKMNQMGGIICNLNPDFGKKQPFETIFIACPDSAEEYYQNLFKNHMNIIMSIPSLIHSHKPPILDIFRKYIQIEQPQCLEIFARYLQPDFTSIGLEVLKLMDCRLYDNETDL